MLGPRLMAVCIVICCLILRITATASTIGSTTDDTPSAIPSNPVLNNPTYVLQSSEDSWNEDTPINTANKALSLAITEGEVLWETDKRAAKNRILSVFPSIFEYKLNDTLVIDAYHLLGKTMIDLKELREGIDTLKHCIYLKQALYGSNHSSLYKTYNYMGIGYFYLHEHDEAINHYKKAAYSAGTQEGGEKDFFLAIQNVGIVHARLGKYDLARDYFDSASSVINTPPMLADTLISASFYSNFGLLSTLMGRIDEGNEYFNISETLYRAKFGPDYYKIAYLNNSKGVNAHFNYDFSKAKLYFKTAIDVLERSKEDTVYLARAYSNLGATYIKTDQYREAINMCKKGLELKPDFDMAILLNQNLAQAYMLLKEYDQADYYYQKALDLSTHDKMNPSRVFKIYMRYADFLLETQDYDRSLTYYVDAMDLARQVYGDHSPELATIYGKLGDFYQRNSFQEALTYYDKSIDVWTRILHLDNDDITPENHNEIRFINAFYGKSKTLLSMFYANKDADLLMQADKLCAGLLDRIESISHNLDMENRLILNKMVMPIYGLAIDASFQTMQTKEDAFGLEKAFNYAERSKSSVLLSSVKNNNALRTSDIPTEVIELEHDLQQEINAIQQSLVDEKAKPKPSSQRLTFYENHMLKLMLEHDSLIRQMETSFPKYYSMKYDRNVVTPAELISQLGSEELMLEYTLTDSLLFIISVDHQALDIHRIKIDSGFFESLNHLVRIKDFKLASQTREDYDQFIAHALNLGEYLIQPVANRMVNKRLVIIPDGLLGYLPFEILLTAAPDYQDIDYANLPYLFQKVPISYSYSATLRYYNENLNQDKKGAESEGLLAFAPKYDLKGNHIQTRAKKLKNLPYAEEEVLGIKEIMGGEAIINEEATKHKFLQEAQSGDFLHLAMHAQINDTLPMFSNLVFYQEDADSLDYHLNTYEIFGLDLKASMVTLSACNTGSGKFQKGEGIMSFARGFIYAGVPSIIMTLWEIQDKSGSDIMKAYYTFLKNGLPKDVALQQAKNKVLQQANMSKSHPYYWSAYIVSGETDPIPADNKLYYVLLIASFLLVIILLPFSELQKEKRKYINVSAPGLLSMLCCLSLLSNL